MAAIQHERTDTCGRFPLAISRWMNIRKTTSSRRRSDLEKPCSLLPRTSEARLVASLADRPLDFPALPPSNDAQSMQSETVLYLGYGSNMCAETFRGRRNIQPLSQVNVVVPELTLTFDLPGIPYSEPCFGNVRYRHTSPSICLEKPTSLSETSDFHKDRWQKGLVGVVYEVTQADYAHIIATEGGGASYQDVLVDCFPLGGIPTEEVPDFPSGVSFKAHTLFAPVKIDRRIASYAQPSPRYLKLITDGAEEHSLPFEYQEFLNGIRTYKITTTRQQLGQFLFLSIWAPVFAFLFGGARLFVDKDGRYPGWYARFAMAAFAACWGSYDDFFKQAFGDGERTIDRRDEEFARNHEMVGLIDKGSPEYGTCQI